MTTSKHEISIQRGCEYNCRYCMARCQAVMENKLSDPQAWSSPVIETDKVDGECGHFDGPVVFPAGHDITPRNLSECMVVLQKLLEAGNQVLIETKPTWSCLALICKRFEQFKRQMTIKVNIGSLADEVLAFWEPDAPNASQRLGCLQYAFDCGFTTSVSCAPILDAWPWLAYEACVSFVTDSFEIDILHNIEATVDLAGLSDYQVERYVTSLQMLQDQPWVRTYFRELNRKPYVKFSESIMEMIGWQNTGDRIQNESSAGVV